MFNFNMFNFNMFNFNIFNFNMFNFQTINNFLINFFVKKIPTIYIWYDYIWKLIFTYINKIILIYHIGNDNIISNITLNYYFGYGLNKYKNGPYYLKLYNKYDTVYLACNGTITDITRNISVVSSHKQNNKPKRKKIILMNNDMTINVDLKILDNYFSQITHYENLITDLKIICDTMGIKCTHINVINLNPFSKTLLDINQTDIRELYDNC